MFRVTVGLSVVMVGLLAASSSANAQTQLNGRWANAKNTSFYLSVSGGGQCGQGHGGCWFNNGQQLILWNQTTNDQLWYSTPNTTSPVDSVGYLDPTLQYNMCIGVTNGSITPGANLIVWQCDSSSNQNWDIIPAGNYPFNLNAPGCYVFQTSDGQVMAVANGTMSNGTHIIQWPVSPPQHPATLDMAWCPM